MKALYIILLCLAASIPSGCMPGDIKDQMKKQMEEHMESMCDQDFKTAIALVELHKILFGEYPASLDSLKYRGMRDSISFNTIRYKKLEEGYQLDMPANMPCKNTAVKLPREFWRGLGLRKSNMMADTGSLKKL